MRLRLAAPMLAAALVLAGCAEDSADPGASGGSGPAAPETGPIKIGAVLDITGAGANLGVPERDTIALLAEQLNAKGGVKGRQVQLTILDDQSTEDGASKAVSRLLNEEKVSVVLGASRTGPSLAMRPLAEAAKVPMISLAANQRIVDGSSWVFKTAQNDRVVAENLAAYMAQKGWKKVGLARDSSAFGEGVKELIDEAGQAQGISVVTEQKFAPDATEFTAQMVSLRNAAADVNVIWGIPPAAAVATKAYRQLGITTPLMHSHGIGTRAFLQTAGADANGVVFPIGRLLVAGQLPETSKQKPVITGFIRDYTARYGSPPSTFAGHAYDGFSLAVDAFTAVGTDPAKVRDHLENRKDFAGISGIFNFSKTDHSGLSREALVMVEVKNDDWSLASTQVTSL